MDRIIKVKENFEEKSSLAINLESLENLRLEFIGKKGQVTALMQLIKEVENNKKKEFGQSINSLKNFVEERLKNLKIKLEQKQFEQDLKNEKQIDITLPVSTESGSLHPRTILQKEIEDIFSSMGFSIEDGNEIETEFNNFDAVNVSKNHPARDMHDTFWLNNGQVLKTHTSALQNKILKKYNGAFKAIFPGRCFRNEALDNSHENTFFQLEGMFVDENVSISNLIFFMKKMLSEVFKKQVNVRLRPGYFPFVEPGFELDAECTFCSGDGCKVCKQTGWIELCPCGMIHPNVFKLAGYDTAKYSGFAFGLGFDRLLMLQKGFDDIRHLNSGNLKVLQQFKTKA